jgi:hypothetical protein
MEYSELVTLMDGRSLDVIVEVTTPDPREYDFQESSVTGWFIDTLTAIADSEVEALIGSKNLDAIVERAIEKYWDMGGSSNEYAD